MFEDPANMRLQNNAIFYREILSDNEMNGVSTPMELQNTRTLDEYRATEEFTNYERLCRGEETVVSRYPFLSCTECRRFHSFSFRALMQLVGHKEGYLAVKSSCHSFRTVCQKQQKQIFVV